MKKGARQENDTLGSCTLDSRPSVLFRLGVFVSIMVAFAAGRALSREGADPAQSDSLGLMDGAVFALLGLLFAFTFSSAADRFAERRTLIIQEANAISTARLRVDLVPTDMREPLLFSFDRYIQSRVDSYDYATDRVAFAAGLKKSEALQQEIWNQAIEAGRRPDAAPALNEVLLPALNDMFDIVTTRTMAMATHASPVVIISLYVATLLATAMAGYASRSASQVRWASVASYAALTALAIHLIIDFEYPRAGLIRVDDFDVLIRNQLQHMPNKDAPAS
jgi:hypothetical protein